MIMLPDHVKFVMLSVTIGQKEIFAKWIETIKNREVVICHTDHRVVPFYFYDFFTCHRNITKTNMTKNGKKP